MERLSCASFLDAIRKEGPFLEELARHESIRPRYEGENLVVDCEMSGLSAVAQQWVESTATAARDLIDLWLRARVVADGPKVFRPTMDQCLAMEQVAPRLALADYAQPYPVMLVELAEAYRKLRACPANSRLFVGEHSPEGVLIGFHPPPVSSLWVQALFSSGIINRFAITAADATIEDGIVREFGDSYVGALPMTVPERVVTASVVRIAVNAMLLLTDFGCKRLGPANESQARRLERYLKLARKRRQDIAGAERNLRLATQLYGFSQEVVLHEEQAGSGPGMEPARDNGQPVRPHWRRGHWKMHAHGPGLSLRKRILIKPVLVNRDLLRGERVSFQTTYRVEARANNNRQEQNNKCRPDTL